MDRAEGMPQWFKIMNNTTRFNTLASFTKLLATVLQDPPELVDEIPALLDRPGSNRDAVLARKRSLPKRPLLNAARGLNDWLVAYGTLSQRAPIGFHGFGAFLREAVEDGMVLWPQRALSLRQALTSASHSRELLAYDLQGHKNGLAIDSRLGCVRADLDAVLSGDAISIRPAMGLGLTTLLLALLLGTAVLVKVAPASSYSVGTPTLMLLMLASLGLQALTLSLLAYQIENLDLPIQRQLARARKGGNHHGV